VGRRLRWRARPAYFLVVRLDGRAVALPWLAAMARQALA
jgi:hypothetical protein